MKSYEQLLLQLQIISRNNEVSTIIILVKTINTIYLIYFLVYNYYRYLLQNIIITRLRKCSIGIGVYFYNM